MRKILLALVLVVLIFTQNLNAQNFPKDWKSKLLGSFDSSLQITQIWDVNTAGFVNYIESNSKYVCFQVGDTEKGFALWLNGKLSSWFKYTVSRPTINPETLEYYTATLDPTDAFSWNLVHNGYENSSYKTYAGLQKISPDGSRKAIVAQSTNKEYYMIIDGEGHYTYDFIFDPVFSPNSQRYMYIAGNQIDGKASYFAVIDDMVGKSYDIILFGTFSPNSYKVAYVAQIGEEYYCVVNGVAGSAYKNMSKIIFSPDSRHLSYVAKNIDGWVMVSDGLAGKAYDDMSDIVYSPDSQRTAYYAKKNGKYFYVVDGAAAKAYDAVYGFAFSPNSKRYAYFAQNFYEDIVLVLDGVETELSAINVDNLIFSPDSKRVAYFASFNEDTTSLVMNGVDITPKGLLLVSNSLSLASDGRLNAVFMYKEKKANSSGENINLYSVSIPF